MSRRFQGIEPGQLVVVSHLPDATIYRVKAIKGFNVGVIDAGLAIENQAVSWHDRSIFLPLTVGQLARVSELKS
jgi:hypothetical protein